ncbi:MAG: Lrp/AsnC family transcriptional regulator [Brevundimonas sp.]|nr:Lrp/AsnC family transcriptional regulator [Brevundimonas sp.]
MGIPLSTGAGALCGGLVRRQSSGGPCAGSCSFQRVNGIQSQNLRTRPDLKTISAVALDDTDRKMIRALQGDGRMTNADLAKAVNLSESACLRRLRALEAAEVISRYTAIINERAVGLPISVFVTVTLSSQAESALTAFETAIATVPEVVECYLMTGGSDYLLRLVVRDVDDLERVHSRELTRIPGVTRVSSSVAMRTVVKRGALPV